MVGKVRKFQTRVTISLSAHDHEHLERVAKLEEVSISQVIRRAVREHIERQVQRELTLGAPLGEPTKGKQNR